MIRKIPATDCSTTGPVARVPGALWEGSLTGTYRGAGNRDKSLFGVYLEHILAGVGRIFSNTCSLIQSANPLRTRECPPERLIRLEGLPVGFWLASKTLQWAML
jgi:hypothetical protein